MSDAMLCVRNGEVRALVIIEDDEIFRETMAEWTADPATEAILKVTVETARAAFLQPAAGIISSLFPQPAPVPHVRGITDEMIEAACAAHWPQPWPGDRSEHILLIRRSDMRKALSAALATTEGSDNG